MADTLHESVLDAAVAAVQAESLDGIPSERVYKRKLPDTAAVQFPCVLVTLEGSRERVFPIDTENDQRNLPVSVMVIDRSDRRDDSDLSTILAWRQAVVDAFLMQLFAAMPTVWHVELTPLNSIDAERAVGPETAIGAGSFSVEAWAVTPRRRPNG